MPSQAGRTTWAINMATFRGEFAVGDAPRAGWRGGYTFRHRPVLPACRPVAEAKCFGAVARNARQQTGAASTILNWAVRLPFQWFEASVPATLIAVPRFAARKAPRSVSAARNAIA